MVTKSLQELVREIEETLHAGGPIKHDDRDLLEQLRRDLRAVLDAQPSPGPHSLRDQLRVAIGRLQAEHPRLSALLSSTFDALSDLGV
jgi:hypothetical protein